MLALPALIFPWLPGWGRSLALDRTAVHAGEFWRLWSGHWVHFSPSHLGWNVLVLLAAGTGLELWRPGLAVRHALGAAPLIGLAILLGEPGLQSYGGLSGLATGMVLLLALHQVKAAGPNRRLWAAMLALVGLKCGADFLGIGPQFARYTDPRIVTSTMAHPAGAVAALLHFALACRRPGRRRRILDAAKDTAGTRDGFPAARFRHYP